MLPDDPDRTAPGAEPPPGAIVPSVLPPTPPIPAFGPPPRERGSIVRGPATGILIAVVFVAGIAIGRIAPATEGGQGTSPNGTAGPGGAEVDGVALFEEAWDLLHEQYVGKDDLDDRELAYAAIDGLADGVGDTGHTTFLTPEDRESRNDSLSGSYVGIGVQVDETEEGGALIVGVFRDSPAEKAGLTTGDEILAVDGEPMTGESLEDVIERIRGEAGTSVDVTVRRGADGPERTVSIVRAEVEIDAVSWTIVPGTTTGMLRIEQFSNGVADDTKAALEELRTDGADRLVLDLRGNPGGYVGEAVGVASQFLAEGTVYVERNAQGEEKETPVSGEGAWTDLPMVVLVDQGSASSSEIVAGALQDHERAEVIGTTTFGTGTVLGEFGLSDGSALRIGTVEWLTPDGRRIWHEGIEPDVAVERPLDVLPTVPEDVSELEPEAVDDAVDPELDRALEVLAAD